MFRQLETLIEASRILAQNSFTDDGRGYKTIIIEIIILGKVWE